MPDDSRFCLLPVRLSITLPFKETELTGFFFSAEGHICQLMFLLYNLFVDALDYKWKKQRIIYKYFPLTFKELEVHS